jgi:Zinc finger, C3HC4 type (RING finger)
MTTSQIVSIYFKVIRTIMSATYEVDINWTTEKFINIMREKVINDFNLENVEFVDTENNLPRGVAAEDGPAIQRENIKLIDKYGNRIYQIAFYIRPIPFAGLEIETIEETVGTSYLPIERSCVICMSQERNMVFLPCNHLCSCSQCGLNPTIRVCPICRVAFNNRIVVYV